MSMLSESAMKNVIYMYLQKLNENKRIWENFFKLLEFTSHIQWIPKYMTYKKGNLIGGGAGTL